MGHCQRRCMAHLPLLRMGLQYSHRHGNLADLHDSALDILGGEGSIDMTDRKILFMCSPTKNTECSKTNCYINDGNCYHTIDPRFAKKFVANFIAPSDGDEAEYFYKELIDPEEDE